VLRRPGGAPLPCVCGQVKPTGEAGEQPRGRLRPTGTDEHNAAGDMRTISAGRVPPRGDEAPPAVTPYRHEASVELRAVEPVSMGEGFGQFQHHGRLLDCWYGGEDG
jgi:hypothetical protein